MKYAFVALTALSLGTFAFAGAGPSKPAGKIPTGRVFFVEPADGAKVPTKFKVKFGIEGLTVAPAGPVKEGTGHHHLLIDREPIAAGVVVPTADTAIHFGKGQTETEITLKPGKHTLTLQFADGLHQSYGRTWSATVTVDVQAAGR